jgi:hypothetical protein
MTGKDIADTFKPRVIPKQPRTEYLPERQAIARVASSFAALVFLGTYCVIAFYALWLPNILASTTPARWWDTALAIFLLSQNRRHG